MFVILKIVLHGMLLYNVNGDGNIFQDKYKKINLIKIQKKED